MQVYLPRVESSQRIIVAEEEKWTPSPTDQEDTEDDARPIELYPKQKTTVKVSDEKGSWTMMCDSKSQAYNQCSN